MSEINVTIPPLQNSPLGHYEVPEVIVRTGDAPEVFPPRRVELAGNIFAPGEFVTKRAEEVQALRKVTNVVVDYDRLSIELTVNEENHFAKVIKGQLTHFPEFLEFGINRQKNFTVASLYKMLRLKRAFFSSRENHAAILDQLKKFEAKTEVEFKQMNDFKGSTALQKIQVCKTNLSYNFTLTLPIYKGMDPVTFPVEIEFEPTDGSIVCWLISEDLAELEVKQRDEIMKGELAKFEGFVVVQR